LVLNCIEKRNTHEALATYTLQSRYGLEGNF